METTQREPISPELVNELEISQKEAYEIAKNNPQWWKTFGDSIIDKDAYVEAAQLGREMLKRSVSDEDEDEQR